MNITTLYTRNLIRDYLWNDRQAVVMFRADGYVWMARPSQNSWEDMRFVKVAHHDDVLAEALQGEDMTTLSIQSNPADRLSVDDYNALAAYAVQHGRCWRSAMREEWFAGTDVGWKRRLRNQVGSTCLSEIRLPR